MLKIQIIKLLTPLLYPLISTPLSEECVSIAKNQYDYLKYLKLNNSSDSKFNHDNVIYQNLQFKT